jgi:hypothetical protein
MPIAFGAHSVSGVNVIASKNIGERWLPFPKSKNKNQLDVIYLPVIFIDRMVWHPKRQEKEGSVKLRDDYPYYSK